MTFRRTPRPDGGKVVENAAAEVCFCTATPALNMRSHIAHAAGTLHDHEVRGPVLIHPLRAC